jgi:hypothetical protein
MGKNDKRQQGNGQPPSKYQNALDRNRNNAANGAPVDQSEDRYKNTGRAAYVEQTREDDGVKGVVAGTIAESTFKTKAILVVAVAGAILWFTLEIMRPKVLSPSDPDYVGTPGGTGTAHVIANTVRSVAATVEGPAQPAGVANTKPGKKDPDEGCTPDEALKTMGTQFLPLESYRNAVPIIIRNKSDMVAFVDLRNPNTQEIATTAVLLPGEAIKFPNVGHSVAGSVSVGTLWCNRKVGWKDARTTPIRSTVVATTDTLAIKMALYDMGGDKLGARVFNERPGKLAPDHFN